VLYHLELPQLQTTFMWRSAQWYYNGSRTQWGQ